MARKSKNNVVPLSGRRKKGVALNGGSVSATHNGGPDGLSQEQRDELALQHKRGYQAALEKKKKADADFKNYCKKVRGDLGRSGVLLIKDMIALETDDGEAELRGDIQRHLEASRIMGAGLATQLEMFTAADAEAKRPMPYRDGFRAGLAGEPAKPPAGADDQGYQGWLKGHADGNAKLAKGIKRKPRAEVRPSQ